MNPSSDTSQRLLACLSDTSRYRIVRLLGGEERCVTEIARAIGLSQSCTTRHLQALARGHVVRRRRDGKRVLFRLDGRDPTVRELLTWLGARPGDAGDAVAPGRQARVGRERAEATRGGRAAAAPRPAAERPRKGDPATDSARAGDPGGAAPGTGEDSPDAGAGSHRRVRRDAGRGGATGTPLSGRAVEPDPADPADTTQAQLPRPRPGDLEDYLL